MTNAQPGGDGISRRDLIKRGALVGSAVVWAPPVIDSLTSPAFGTVGSPRDRDISFVALLLACGGLTFRAKFEAPFPSGTFGPSECGARFTVDGCLNQLSRGSAVIQSACPPGVTATFSPLDGSLVVTLGACLLKSYVVKCGVPGDPDDSGCVDPFEEITQPAIPVAGVATFVPCTLGDVDGGLPD